LAFIIIIKNFKLERKMKISNLRKISGLALISLTYLSIIFSMPTFASAPAKVEKKADVASGAGGAGGIGATHTPKGLFSPLELKDIVEKIFNRDKDSAYIQDKFCQHKKSLAEKWEKAKEAKDLVGDGITTRQAKSLLKRPSLVVFNEDDLKINLRIVEEAIAQGTIVFQTNSNTGNHSIKITYDAGREIGTEYKKSGGTTIKSPLRKLWAVFDIEPIYMARKERKDWNTLEDGMFSSACPLNKDEDEVIEAAEGGEVEALVEKKGHASDPTSDGSTPAKAEPKKGKSVAMGAGGAGGSHEEGEAPKVPAKKVEPTAKKEASGGPAKAGPKKAEVEIVEDKADLSGGAEEAPKVPAKKKAPAAKKAPPSGGGAGVAPAKAGPKKAKAKGKSSAGGGDEEPALVKPDGFPGAAWHGYTLKQQQAVLVSWASTSETPSIKIATAKKAAAEAAE
jgi:hypothetical protein